MDSLFDNLTPEQLAALLQGSTLQDEGTLLQQQLAELLGPTEHRQYSTPLGAGLGGIAEAMDGTANAFHAKALRGQQQQNLDAQGKLKGDFAQLLRGPKPDPAAEFALPLAALKDSPLSAPPMLEANADIPQDGVFPMGIDLTPGNQPADPTQIVDNGSDGWGLDLSDPKHVAAMAKGAPAPIPPNFDISAFPEVANAHLPQLRKKRGGGVFAF